MSLEAKARSILGPSARFMAAGATCAVYTDGRQALRLALSSEARLKTQTALMRALSAAGVPVPEVLEVGVVPDGRAYCLETFVGGDDGGPSRQGWADLGRALGILHALSHCGFGLLDDGAGGFRGVASTPADGLRTRLNAWPLNGLLLSDQPLSQHAPNLAGPLAALEPELRHVITGQTAVCHTDLHGGQFRWHRGRLLALLDFGDAAVGPPAWDGASLAYFHGWTVAEQVAQAARLPCGRDAALFGLLLAFHRANRAGEQDRPERVAQAAAFARSCLERL